MNGIFTKIILFFIVLVLLGLLTLSSFGSGNKSNTVLPDFGKSEIGEYGYTATASGELLKSQLDFNDISSMSGVVLLEKNTGVFTSIYSDGTGYSAEEKGNTIDIKMGTGVFLVDSRSPFKTVNINMGTYSVELEEGGALYVENIGKRTLIVSLNSIAEINFIKEDKSRGVNVFLYPHMYLSFDETRLSKKIELDSLRLSQLSTLGYFPETFSTILDGNLGGLIEKGDFLMDALDQMSIKKIQNDIILKNNIPNKVAKIPGAEYIEEYFSLFYNERKRLLYEQNNVLEKIIELSREESVNETLIVDIIESLNKLEMLDGMKYNETSLLIDQFSQLAFTSIDNSILISNFTLLNKKRYSREKELMNFSETFDKFNFYGKKTFYKKIQSQYSENLDGGIMKQDYYLYFVRNIILEGFENGTLGENDFNILIDVLGEYAKNLDVSGITQDSTVEITNVLYNKKILEAIEDALLSRYFTERNSENLLVRTKQNIVNISGFEKAINSLYIYFIAKNKLLTINLSKYSKDIAGYEALNIKFEEYLSALKNYSQYQKKYGYKEIVVIGDNVDHGLSQNKFLDYISQFNGINLGSIDVETTDAGYMVNNILITGYTVNNILVNREFSFLLNPDRGNRLNNIVLKDLDFTEKSREAIFYSQLSNTTYDMDDEKRKYEELLKNSNNDDKEKNDFKNFLKNNFFPQEGSTAVDCVDDVDCGGRDTEVQNDDEFVQLLKTATLLSRTEGEFRNIREILDVKYNNLVVKKLEDLTFDISIVDSTLSVPVLLNNREMKISADFNSYYELEGGHFFSDILLKPFTPESNGGKKYIFNDIELSIKGNISIETFEESMKKIYENFDYIEGEYKEYTLKNTGRIRQIEFTPDTKLVNFK